MYTDIYHASRSRQAQIPAFSGAQTLLVVSGWHFKIAIAVLQCCPPAEHRALEYFCQFYKQKK